MAFAAARRRRTRRCGLRLWAALLSCTPAAALAQEANGQRVLLVENGRDPFLERVGAEVEALGFVLVRSATNAALETVARAERAVAALRVLPSRKGVEVWMADATSGRSLLRQMIVDENPGGPNRELIALQTAELLRTSLLAKEAAPEPSAPVARPDDLPTANVGAATAHVRTPRADTPAAAADVPAAESGDAPHSRDTEVQLTLGALIPSGGVGVAAQAGLSVQHFPTKNVGVALDAGAPLGAGTITGVEGSSSIATFAAGAALLTRLEPHPNPLFVTFGVGAAALLVKYEGETSEPLRSTSGSQFAAAAYLRGDAGIAITPWFRLGVRVLAGLTFQRIAIEFAGNHAGDFGPVLFSASGLAGLALL